MICSISHCCNEMGCEPVQISTLCMLFKIHFKVVLYIHIIIITYNMYLYDIFWLCLPVLVRLFMCLYTDVCMWLVEGNEKPRVWQGSHCGCRFVYTSFRLVLCVWHAVFCRPFKHLYTDTHIHMLKHPSAAFIFISLTIVRIWYKPEVKSRQLRVKALEIISLVKPGLMLHSATGLSQHMSHSSVWIHTSSTKRLKTI